jgi:hypothetical protein
VVADSAQGKPYFHPLATLGGVVVSDGTGPDQEQRINTGDEPDTFPYSGRDLPYAVWVDWPTELNSHIGTNNPEAGGVGLAGRDLAR